MKRKLMTVLAMGLLGGAAFPAGATLLTAGDFDSASLNGVNSYSIGGNLNKWLMHGYSLQAPGPSGLATDRYAQHTTAGTGTDFRLVQFIDASGFGVGQTLDLFFDYIYDEAAGFDPQARVSLIGITVNRNYSLFGGAGVDGIFGGGDFDVAAPDALLGQLELAYSSVWSINNTLSANLGTTYSYIGVVFTSGCFGNSETCATLRGIDNVLLQAKMVPEPGTLALLGLGLAGLGFARRKKLN